MRHRGVPSIVVEQCGYITNVDPKSSPTYHPVSDTAAHRVTGRRELNLTGPSSLGA